MNVLGMGRAPRKQMQVEFGNAGETDTRGTGWFIGFSDWAKSGAADLRFMPVGRLSRGLCVKWFEHAAGHPNGDLKPVSEGRTISMLVSRVGEFRIEFSLDNTFPSRETLAHVLRRPGDYAIWGEGIYHRAFGIKKSTILTVRWTPVSGETPSR